VQLQGGPGMVCKGEKKSEFMGRRSENLTFRAVRRVNGVWGRVLEREVRP